MHPIHPSFPLESFTPVYSRQATAYLRFIQVYSDMKKYCLQEGGNCLEKDIIILGLGLLKTQDASHREQCHCPQLSEMERLFRKVETCRILIIDNNPDVLNAAHQIDHALAQRWINATVKLYKMMERVQAYGVIASDHRKLLEDFQAEEDPTYSSLQRCKINILNKDIGCIVGPNSAFDTTPQADVILATCSLVYPLAESELQGAPREERIALFGKWVSQLTPGGVLYLDHEAVNCILATSKISLEELVQETSAEGLVFLVEEMAKQNIRITTRILPPAYAQRTMPAGIYSVFSFSNQTTLDSLQRTTTQTVIAFQRSQQPSP